MDAGQDTAFFPQTIEHQGCPDGQVQSADIAFSGENQHRFVSKPGKRANQYLDSPLFVKLVYAPDGGDHTLLYAALFFVVIAAIESLPTSNLATSGRAFPS